MNTRTEMMLRSLVSLGLTLAPVVAIIRFVGGWQGVALCALWGIGVGHVMNYCWPRKGE